ncbi:DUF4265 domain-containing protein [Caulobacter sp. LARHSG274]
MTKLVKIAFHLSGDDARNGFEIERLWATPLEDDLYVLDNSPFQVYGVSFGDKVLARSQNGDLTFISVAERGGHSTYRVMLPTGKGHDYFLKYWPKLEACGCSYEGATGDQQLYSLDVPSLDAVQGVYDVLQENENAGVWEFEEAHYFGND